MEDSHKKKDHKDSTKTVLIADEEDGTRFLLKFELEERGYRVLTADSVSTAYKIFKEEQKVDLYIVSSIYSSDELNEKFKEQKPYLKIIIYSSHAEITYSYSWGGRPWADNCVLKLG
jgi:DNA-binding NtrC family response regulator